MRKILWLCNIPLPIISSDLSLPSSSGGGWLVGLSSDLMSVPDMELAICFPCSNKSVFGQVKNIKYFGILQKYKSETKYDSNMENQFKKVLIKYKPDIIHIWGTEYPHTLAMVNACKSLDINDKVVISIQGLVSVYHRHYLAQLPIKAYSRFSFRDFIKQDNLIQSREKFRKRGIFEINSIKDVHHIIGRTDWDRACTMLINPNAKYHFCNETLRDSFYNHQWNLDHCEKYSIFVSQALYPIKGLHFVIEAMSLIRERFANVHLYIAGRDITNRATLKDKLKLSSYGKYIISLIKQYRLEKYISFTGNLDENQMCEQYLKSHVFVSPSSIENSPNSVGEAMILGVPVIASDVGGVKNLLVHEEEGFLYQVDAPYMLAYYVCEIFKNDELALEISKKARIHALKTHNRCENRNKMINIYHEIKK